MSLDTESLSAPNWWWNFVLCIFRFFPRPQTPQKILSQILPYFPFLQGTAVLNPGLKGSIRLLCDLTDPSFQHARSRLPSEPFLRDEPDACSSRNRFRPSFADEKVFILSTVVSIARAFRLSPFLFWQQVRLRLRITLILTPHFRLNPSLRNKKN